MRVFELHYVVLGYKAGPRFGTEFRYLLIASAWLCQQHSRNQGPVFS